MISRENHSHGRADEAEEGAIVLGLRDFDAVQRKG